MACVLFDWKWIDVFPVVQLVCFIYVENGRARWTKLVPELAFISFKGTAFAA